MSNFINAEVEELREHLKKYYDETIYLEGENKKLREDGKSLESAIGDVVRENRRLKEELDRMTKRACDYKGEITELKMENKKLREELSAYDREYFDEDNKAENIYKNQKENILMGKI